MTAKITSRKKSESKFIQSRIEQKNGVYFDFSQFSSGLVDVVAHCSPYKSSKRNQHLYNFLSKELIVLKYSVTEFNCFNSKKKEIKNIIKK